MCALLFLFCLPLEPDDATLALGRMRKVARARSVLRVRRLAPWTCAARGCCGLASMFYGGARVLCAVVCRVKAASVHFDTPPELG
jgi:hypothetical protein